MIQLRRGNARRVATGVALACAFAGASIGVASAASSSKPLKKGLSFAVIPKNLGNSYFVTSDSVKTHGALYALKQLGEKGYETSGSTALASSQLPAITAAIAKKPSGLLVSATDPTALCPTLNSYMKKGGIVVTYDSDAPTCRTMFINQASTAAIGASEVDIMAKELNDTGQIAIVSAAQTATNQNAWIGYMQTELKKYPNMSLATIVYGNDVPATATQVTQGLLQQYPNLKGIISPTTVGILAAAQILDTPQYKGKVLLTGLGTPDAMKPYVEDGTVTEFELWNPASLGYLAAYTAVELASKAITNKPGQTFKAGSLGKYKVGAGHTILLGKPYVFDKANNNNFNF
jgi:rhamnose transport system substrate-binding protein